MYFKTKKMGYSWEAKRDARAYNGLTVFQATTSATTDLPGRKRRGVSSTFYDPRPIKSRRLDPEAVENFREAIFGANPSVPFG